MTPQLESFIQQAPEYHALLNSVLPNAFRVTHEEFSQTLASKDFQYTFLAQFGPFFLVNKNNETVLYLATHLPNGSLFITSMNTYLTRENSTLKFELTSSEHNSTFNDKLTYRKEDYRLHLFSSISLHVPFSYSSRETTQEKPYIFSSIHKYVKPKDARSFETDYMSKAGQEKTLGNWQQSLEVLAECLKNKKLLPFYKHFMLAKTETEHERKLESAKKTYEREIETAKTELNFFQKNINNV